MAVAATLIPTYLVDSGRIASTIRILQISACVATIAASVENQAAKLREVNGPVGALDGITRQTAAMVEETSAAARSLAEQSRTLVQEISRLQLGQAGSAKSMPTLARAA